MEASAVKVKHPDLEARDLTIEMRAATELPQPTATKVNPSFELLPDSSSIRRRDDQPYFSKLAPQPAFQPNPNERYDVGSFMHLYDIDFVEAVFRAILKREPDQDGFRFYLHGLRSGTFDRVEVIAALLESDEGKGHKVRVTGLSLPRLMRRVTTLPLIGYPIRVVLDLLRLPLLIRRLNDSIASTTQVAHLRYQQIIDHLNTTDRLTTEYLDGLSVRVDQLGEKLAAKGVEQQTRADEFSSRLALVAETQAQNHDVLSTQVSTLANELNSRLVSIMNTSQEQLRETTTQIQEIRDRHADLARYSETEIANLLSHAQQVRREVALQRAVVAVLEESNQLPPKRDEVAASTAGPRRSLDAVYVELEDRFRGSRDEVKKSQAFYLPLVQSAPHQDLPIVDLGCGRGEWLELLREAGANAIGVDTNRVMIGLCRERGLEVVEQDALSYLRGLPDESLRAVTGFHIIEHLPTEMLMLLLDQIMRTLRTGGFVSFETPNPDNLFVSGNYFYFDPSHRHPLPSKLVKLFLESRGFQNINTTPLHPCAEGRFAGNDDVSKRLNDLFYGPMDYAIVGWKLDR